MNEIVYHGSSNGNIEFLKPHITTHQQECIYATDNKVIAMMFMGRGNGDLDVAKYFKDGIPLLIERRPNVLKQLYDKEGYIYELPGESFNHYSFLWTPEVISYEKSIKPLKVEYHKNILNSLENEALKGNLILYQYPNRPNYIPLDNSDLIDKYIYFEQQGIKDSIKNLLRIYPEFEEEVNNRLISINMDSKQIIVK